MGGNEEHTLKTEASKRSFPDARFSRGLSRFRARKRPSGERKSGIPAWTEIPAPRDTDMSVSRCQQSMVVGGRTADDDDALCLEDGVDDLVDLGGWV
jgi:hypothetical protein